MDPHPSAAPTLEILPGQVNGPFDFPALFGNRHPVEMEIGIGKGRFLLAQAEARPEVNFLGIEWSLKYLRVARDRARRRGLANIRLFRADARHVLAALLRDRSLARVHVYCPDPWPKKRHHKRRLFSRDVVPHIERILAPGGYLNVSTDFSEYFAAIVAVVAERTRLERAADPVYPIEGQAGKTNYEVKYLAAGRAIHRATWRRPTGYGSSTTTCPASTLTG